MLDNIAIGGTIADSQDTRDSFRRAGGVLSDSLISVVFPDSGRVFCVRLVGGETVWVRVA